MLIGILIKFCHSNCHIASSHGDDRGVMHFQINTDVGLGFSYSCATSKVLPKYWLGNAFCRPLATSCCLIDMIDDFFTNILFLGDLFLYK